MTRNLVFRPKAHADLAEIWDFTISQWSEAQAEAYLSGLDDALTLLCAHPEIARLHDFRPPVRIFPYRSHLVVFAATEATVEVIRIPHMRSNWTVLLAE